MSHTPGPWKVNYRRVTPVDGPQDGSNDICHVYGDEDREIANARLIAAAPQLLEALRRTRFDLIAEHGMFGFRTNFAYLDDAIELAAAPMSETKGDE